MNDLEAWQKRAIQAEGKLREIASAPNDTIGWKEMRQALAVKALEDLEIPEEAEGGDSKNSRDRKPSRSRNGNRNGRDKKSDNGGKSSNRKRVSFEDEFEKGL